MHSLIQVLLINNSYPTNQLIRTQLPRSVLDTTMRNPAIDWWMHIRRSSFYKTTLLFHCLSKVVEHRPNNYLQINFWNDVLNDYEENLRVAFYVCVLIQQIYIIRIKHWFVPLFAISSEYLRLVYHKIKRKINTELGKNFALVDSETVIQPINI